MKIRNIRKRPDGRYEARYTVNGKRISVFDTSLRECQRKLAALRRQGHSTNNVPTKTINFNDFLKFWFETFKLPNLKPSTIDFYKNIINTHLAKITTKISDINSIMLQQFLNGLGQTRTKEIAYMTLKQVFKKALELEYIKKDPTQFITKGKVQRKTKVPFTMDEQEKIFGSLTNSRFDCLILTYLMTGIRRGEAVTIKKSDISEDFLHIHGTKTKNAERFIKISKPLREKLLSIEQDPIFEYDTKYVEKHFRAFCEKLNIKGSPHKLRHTFSTNLYYLGVPDKERQVLLGHANTQITNDVYTHLDPRITKEKLINLYGEYLTPFLTP